MPKIPHCPNRDCPTNQQERGLKPEFRKKGFGYNRRFGKMQRYQCRHCLRSFNVNVFHIDYYTHRRISYRQLSESLDTSSGIRDMARKFTCSPKVILNRIERLAREMISETAPILKTMPLQEDLTADGLESFILSQYFPSNINILAGCHSQFIYYYNSFYYHRKGRMREEQKIRSKELYAKACFEKGAPSRNFRELLDSLAEMKERSGLKKLTLHTDQNPIYRYEIRKHPGLDGVRHRTISSKAKRTYQNKLFPCNYIDRQIRKDMAEHTRETVQFSRNHTQSMFRFTVYSFWHNFMKPYRVKKKAGDPKSHGEAAGLSPSLIHRVRRKVFDNSRTAYFKVEEFLNPFQKQLWARELINPLKIRAV